jgi:hypothetical protein
MELKLDDIKIFVITLSYDNVDDYDISSWNYFSIEDVFWLHLF